MRNRSDEKASASTSIGATFVNLLYKATPYRITSFIATIGSYVSVAKTKVISYSFKDALKSFALGDLKNVQTNHLYTLLRNRAASDEHTGIGLAHIGPPRMGINLALVSQRPHDEKLVERQMNTILNASEESSRAPYEIINLVSGASFLLADSSTAAMTAHKELARYLKPKALLEKFKHEMPHFLERVTFQELNENPKALENHIQSLVTKCFTNILFGVEATPTLNQVLSNLLNQLSMDNVIIPLLIQRYLPKRLGFLKEKYLPAIITQYFPAMARMRNEVDQACREFIIERAAKLQILLDNGDSNLLIDTLKKINPENISLTSMTKTQLHTIADHVEIRNALFSLFAIDNAAYTISRTAILTLTLLNDRRVIALQKALDRYSELLSASLSETNKTTLQAIYTCGLLQYSKFPELLRYTKNGIHTPEVDIPANSFIICHLTEKRTAFANLDRMYVGKNIVGSFYASNRLPSKAKQLRIHEQFCVSEKEIKPWIIKLQGPDYYVYGRFDEVNWDITNIGPVPEMDHLFIRKRPTVLLESELPISLYQAIKKHNAHTPFNEPDHLRYKLGEGKFTLFGRGARRCPAAADVGILSKYLIMTMVKHFSQDQRGDLVKRPPALKIPPTFTRN